jgi:ABC-type transport system involved in multi-copper enzyme maturation permease subunit
MILMKNKYGLILVLGIAIAALVGLLFFLKNSSELAVIEYIYLLLVLLIVVGTSIILLKNAKEIKIGLPVGDELTEKTTWKAGYYTYLFSVWVAISLLWYNILVPERFGVPELSVEQVIGILVLLPGAFFIGLAFYFNKKGDV